MHNEKCNAPQSCAWDAGAPICGCNCHVREEFREQFPLDGKDHLNGPT